MNRFQHLKQRAISAIILFLIPDLESVLLKLLEDSKDWAADWGDDYNYYDYVMNAKKILKLINNKSKQT